MKLKKALQKAIIITFALRATAFAACPSWRCPIEAIVGEGSLGKIGVITCGTGCDKHVYRLNNTTLNTQLNARFSWNSTVDNYFQYAGSGTIVGAWGDTISIKLFDDTVHCATIITSTNITASVFGRNRYRVGGVYRTDGFDENCSWITKDGDTIQAASNHGPITGPCYDFDTSGVAPVGQNTYTEACTGDSVEESDYLINTVSDTSWSSTSVRYKIKSSGGAGDEFTTGMLVSDVQMCAINSAASQSFNQLLKPTAYLDVSDDRAAIGMKISRWRLVISGTSNYKWYNIYLTWMKKDREGNVSIWTDRPYRVRGNDNLWYFPRESGGQIAPSVTSEPDCLQYENKVLKSASIVQVN